MSGPIRPEPADPLDQLMAMKGQASALDPLDELMKLKQPHDYHAEYQSGALQKRMQGANARDAANLADEQASQPGYLERFGTHVLNAAQGIPGVHAVEAGAGALKSAGSANLATPEGRSALAQAYRQSLGTLNGATSQIGGKTAAGERIMGSVATLPFLAANPAIAGAELGGADQALSADPNESLAVRAMKTAGGAAAGAVVGKVAEFVPTAARAVFAKAPDANIFARQAARAASAKVLYNRALAEGQGKTGTQAIQQFLAEPDIAGIVDELGQTRPFQGVANDSPEMLDAVYKTLSDRAAQAKRGLDATNPSRPNIGRFRLQDTKAAQGQLLDAMGGGTTMPGPMPTYPTAVADFADKSAGIQAVKQGYAALRNNINSGLPSVANLTRTTPEALSQASGTMSEPERAALGEGVMGGVKMLLKKKPLTEGRRAVSTAPSIMRAANVPDQELSDFLSRLLLTSGNASARP